MRIWLDDLRVMPPGYDIHVKTVNEAIAILKTGNVTHMSFDHDLGTGGEGIDVANFVEEAAFCNLIPPLTWQIHSANPVGARNMRMALENATYYFERN